MGYGFTQTAAYGFHDFSYRRSDSCTDIERRACITCQEAFERLQMGISKVQDVDVVANGGSIWSFVVGAQNG